MLEGKIATDFCRNLYIMLNDFVVNGGPAQYSISRDNKIESITEVRILFEDINPTDRKRYAEFIAAADTCASPHLKNEKQRQWKMLLEAHEEKTRLAEDFVRLFCVEINHHKNGTAKRGPQRSTILSRYRFEKAPKSNGWFVYFIYRKDDSGGNLHFCHLTFPPRNHDIIRSAIVSTIHKLADMDPTTEESAKRVTQEWLVRRPRIGGQEPA